MTIPTLTGIPIELLLEIAEHLSDSPAALSALCRTNVRFYNDLTLSLYINTAGSTSELTLNAAYYLPKQKLYFFPVSNHYVPPTIFTPLHRCAFMGNTAAVEIFLMIPEDRVNAYSTPYSGALQCSKVELTPIFFAGLSGNVATAAMLLSRGADPSLPARVSNDDAFEFVYGTALDVAARQQNEEMVSLLLRHGATSKSALFSLLFPLAASPTRLQPCVASIAERLIAVGGCGMDEIHHTIQSIRYGWF
jgi:ankyrin repeat protein